MRRVVIQIVTFVTLIAVVGVLVGMIGCAPKPAVAPEEGEEEEAIVLKYGHYLSPGKPGTRAVERFCTLVTERTGGRVEFEIYPAESLVTGSESLSVCSVGGVDLTSAYAAYEAGKLPFNASIGMLPFAWKYEDTPEAYYDMGLRELQVPELTAYNLYPLFCLADWAQEWMFREPGVFTTLEKCKGVKVRSFGGVCDVVIDYLGAVPVLTSSSEVYMAGQRGVIDGCSHTITSYFAYHEDEVFPYIVWSDAWSLTGTSVINLDVWQALSPDVKEVFEETAVEITSWLNDEEKASGKASLDKALEEGRVHIYELPAEEKARWLERLSPYYDKLVEDWGERGQKAVDMVEYYQKRYGIK